MATPPARHDEFRWDYEKKINICTYLMSAVNLLLNNTYIDSYAVLIAVILGSCIKMKYPIKTSALLKTALAPLLSFFLGNAAYSAPNDCFNDKISSYKLQTEDYTSNMGISEAEKVIFYLKIDYDPKSPKTGKGSFSALLRAPGSNHLSAAKVSGKFEHNIISFEVVAPEGDNVKVRYKGICTPGLIQGLWKSGRKAHSLSGNFKFKFEAQEPKKLGLPINLSPQDLKLGLWCWPWRKRFNTGEFSHAKKRNTQNK